MPIDAEILRAKLPDRGVELAIYDWGGTGPPLLLAHANGFCAPLWDPVARRLRDQYRVLGYDHRGQGDSSVPSGTKDRVYQWDHFTADYLAVCDWAAKELQLTDPIYAVGHSFGGTSALNAVEQRPELFARACGLDPVLLPPESAPGTVRRGVELAAKTRERRSVWPSRAEVAKSWQDKALFAPWQAESLALYIEHGFRDRADGQVELKCAPAIEAEVFEDRWTGNIFDVAAAIRRPSLIVRATRGHMPQEFVEAIVKGAPFVELIHAPYDHLMVMEAPDEIAKIILEFGRG